jgi:hypothetical protein
MNESAPITPDSITISGGTSASNCCYGTWSTPYYYFSTVPDKFGTAFKIASKLIERKLTTAGKDVPGFIKLINDIVECL